MLTATMAVEMERIDDGAYCTGSGVMSGRTMALTTMMMAVACACVRTCLTGSPVNND